MRLISILAEELETRKEKNSSYSIRAFARDLDISHGHFIQLLSGKKAFTFNSVEKVLNALNIKNSQADLIVKDFKVEEKIKENVKALLNSNINKSSKAIAIGANEYIPISHWSHDAIFHLLEEGALEEQMTSIELKLSFSKADIHKCLENLKTAGLISIVNNMIQKSCDSYHMKGGACEMAMDKLVKSFDLSQKELFSLAMNQFNPLEDNNNQYSTQAYKVPKNQVETIKKSILSFCDSIENTLKLAHSDQKTLNEEHIYFFNTQFFPVTKNLN